MVWSAYIVTWVLQYVNIHHPLDPIKEKEKRPLLVKGTLGAALWELPVCRSVGLSAVTASHRDTPRSDLPSRGLQRLLTTVLYFSLLPPPALVTTHLVSFSLHFVGFVFKSLHISEVGRCLSLSDWLHLTMPSGLTCVVTTQKFPCGQRTTVGQWLVKLLLESAVFNEIIFSRLSPLSLE